MVYLVRRWKISYTIILTFLMYTCMLIVSINDNIEKDLLIEEIIKQNKLKVEPILLEIYEAHEKQRTRTFSTLQIPIKRNYRKRLQTLPTTKPKTVLKRGENGTSVFLTAEEEKENKDLIDKGWKDHYFNEFVSNLISVNRSLLDPRNNWCKEPDRFMKNLPPTSVIICFHNEAWSVLLRTVHSVLNRSPPNLLTEILLIDDFSAMDHLQKPLELYMKQFPKVKIIRNKKREGLIRSRLIGTKIATGPILTFLDSHCECCDGWLEPLLDRIARNPFTVVSPVIDSINEYTFGHYFSNANETQRGGFDWELTFDWHRIPYHVEKMRPNPNAPLETPAIAGGLFSIDKKYFERLGTYDDQFDFWGGENLELSFKVWMCGGRLEIIPCSHVGHVFRSTSPITWNETNNPVENNLARVAEVWLDEYAEFYFDRRQFLIRPENVTQRKLLRKQLKCKNFTWYLENVYPELEKPSRVLAKGYLANTILPSKCLDSSSQFKDYGKNVQVHPCHYSGGNQFWFYDEKGFISKNGNCLDHSNGFVTIDQCAYNFNRIWKYKDEDNQIIHNVTQQCLSLNSETDFVELKPCNISDEKQQWFFEINKE